MYLFIFRLLQHITYIYKNSDYTLNEDNNLYCQPKNGDNSTFMFLLTLPKKYTYNHVKNEFNEMDNSI